MSLKISRGSRGMVVVRGRVLFGLVEPRLISVSL